MNGDCCTYAQPLTLLLSRSLSINIMSLPPEWTRAPGEEETGLQFLI